MRGGDDGKGAHFALPHSSKGLEFLATSSRILLDVHQHLEEFRRGEKQQPHKERHDHQQKSRAPPRINATLSTSGIAPGSLPVCPNLHRNLSRCE